MSREALRTTYRRGTHRLVPPEATLSRIARHLLPLGITRCADVTGLDKLGIPVACSIRPRGSVLQVSNGKGLRLIDAKVSAIMEAIELDHVENPRRSFRRSSLRALRRAGERVFRPSHLPQFRHAGFFSDDFVIDWVLAEELVSGDERWIPASAAYHCATSVCDLTTNGHASGNHLVEATLHALYELVERDAISRLVRRGRLRVARPRAHVVDLATVPTGPVRRLHDRIRAAGMWLVLIWVKSVIAVNTFMAVLLDPEPFGHASTVNMGYGAHRSASVAAIRAITEAAQTRLTFIHGAREDLEPAVYRGAYERAYEYYAALRSEADWASWREMASFDLARDLAAVVRALARAGFRRIFRVDMTHPAFEIPVVKMIVPGLRCEDVF